MQPGRASLPGHAAIYGEVERVGEADDAVDEERDVPNKIVVKKILINTAIVIFLVTCQKYIHRFIPFLYIYI